MSQDEQTADFPWHLGVFDAHCHPTDTMSSIAEIPQMKASTLTVMSTRGEDQDLVLETAVSLTKGQAPSQGSATGRVLPCFGWHPWFSHQIIDDATGSPETEQDISSIEQKKLHYKKVLTPEPDDDFILSLPDPKPISQLLSESRARLTAYPHSPIGEVGLDRAFRLPQPWTAEEKEARDEQTTPGSREGRKLSPYRVQLAHQKAVLEAQLRLAGELQRPVSVHSVQAHGAVFDLFRGLWSGHERKNASRRERRRRYSVTDAHAGSDAEDERRKQDFESPEERTLPFPPRICMHSYSGPVDPLKQFLHQSNPSDVYFSFSSVINFSGPSSQKVIDVIKALPDDRVLIESDLHTAGQQMDDLLEEVARQICDIRGWTLHHGVQQLADNWRRFIFG